MNEIVKKIVVEQELKLEESKCVREYTIWVEFEELDLISQAFRMPFEEIKKSFTSKFIPLLMTNVIKQSKQGANEA